MHGCSNQTCWNSYIQCYQRTNYSQVGSRMVWRMASRLVYQILTALDLSRFTCPPTHILMYDDGDYTPVLVKKSGWLMDSDGDNHRFKHLGFQEFLNASRNFFPCPDCSEYLDQLVLSQPIHTVDGVVSWRTYLHIKLHNWEGHVVQVRSAWEYLRKQLNQSGSLILMDIAFNLSVS